jgi:adenylate cyclase
VVLEYRLAAVLISDVVGYTKRMEEDTEGTVAAWSNARDSLIEPIVEDVDGRVVKFTGDGFLAEFNTVQQALQSAIDLQNKLKNNPLEFRMAINLGDIIDDGRDIHGEGINIAARLEEIAEPGGIVISGDVYNQVKNRIDAKYEDLGPQDVKNVAEPIQAYSVKFTSVEDSPEIAEALTPEEKPSIAVLPFDNMSGDKEQEYFTDGIVEDIITELSRSKDLRVIARNSTFAYKGKSPDIRDVAKQLNVNHVLEGSVRKAGDSVRITAQLIYAEDNSHRWAERFDGKLENIFDLQAEISKKIADQLNVEFSITQISAEVRSLQKKEAEDIARQARETASPPNPRNYGRAMRLYQKALEVDEDCAKAHAGMGLLDITRAWHDVTDEVARKKLVNNAMSGAKKALDINPEEFESYFTIMLGHIIQNQHDKAEEILAELLEEPLGNPDRDRSIALACFFLDKFEPGLERALSAVEMDPLNRRNALAQFIAYYYCEKFSEAIKVFESEYGEFGEFDLNPFGWGVVINCYANSGQSDRARVSLDNLLMTYPQLTASELEKSIFFTDEKSKDKYLSGLKQLGLE